MAIHQHMLSIMHMGRGQFQSRPYLCSCCYATQASEGKWASKSRGLMQQNYFLFYFYKKKEAKYWHWQFCKLVDVTRFWVPTHLWQATGLPQVNQRLSKVIARISENETLTAFLKKCVWNIQLAVFSGLLISQGTSKTYCFWMNSRTLRINQFWNNYQLDFAYIFCLPMLKYYFLEFWHIALQFKCFLSATVTEMHHSKLKC